MAMILILVVVIIIYHCQVKINLLYLKWDKWYKITQTSASSDANAIYKYEISTDSGNTYGDPVTGKTFGQSFTDGDITIGLVVQNQVIVVLEVGN